ncbi:MAG TPA: sodium ion-translocating decarboxylase subunit beta [Anaerolineae bacterium]|nr:sodium ion-translocating decarboxylase subunit beta [Anaerolineae bacterium]HPL27841.1 sodium ion-translocating decarboxylase subunit beta [Anaerolineae bacterium]
MNGIDVTVSSRLIQGFVSLTVGQVIMIAVGGVLIYLAIAKKYEPFLLLPIGIGAIMANVPATGMTEPEGLFGILYNVGIKNELFPLLIFVGVGAMTDFGPLLERPYTVLLGAAAQFGIFGTLLVATLMGFKINEAASIGIIGAADGPTSIYVAAALAPDLLAPIAVAAYSYMSLVPIIQPPIIKALTSKAERAVPMTYSDSKPVSQRTKIVFPIVVSLVCGLIAPLSFPLIGMLMLGNLLREAGVVERLSKMAQGELINMVTLFLGLAIGSTMVADKFLQWQTLGIICMGLVAFALDTVAGLSFGKALSIITRGKVNPLIGACGISAFPMSARVISQVALEANPNNFLIMHAMASNTAGQVASVMAGGAIMALLGH